MSDAALFGALAAPLALVAHDAGAANHMLAWLDGAEMALMPCLAGPALTLWGQSRGALTPCALEDALAASGSLLSGTGWASGLEHEARKIARRLGIESVAVIDHWTNYRERFTRDGEEVLPDQIWVSDEHARELATATFPGIAIVQQPNAYLAGLVRQVERIQGRRPRGNGRVLYVLEPIRQAWGERAQAGEFAALDFFVDNLRRLPINGDACIRLRPHPSDAAGKYDQWIRRQGNRRIALDTAATLAESLAWADWVAGCQTYAMVVALAAGRRVVSTIPPWAPPCVLPHPEIIKLSALAARAV